MTFYWAMTVVATALIGAMVLICIFAKDSASVAMPVIIGLIGTALAFLKPPAESNAAIAKSKTLPPPPEKK